MKRFRSLTDVCLTLVLLLGPWVQSRATAAPSDQAIVVFAAASLTNALQDLGTDFEGTSGSAVKFSFAASSTLARQIETGAPADVFFSADLEWMNYLEARHLIQPQSRHDVLGNRLVLIAPAASTVKLKIVPHLDLVAALGRGRLAVGDPDGVPAGRYAREALTALGVWSSVADRLVRADSVRAALAYVDRREAPLGIVYNTDALIDSAVRIIDVFPDATHAPIVYPIALTVGAKSGAAQFAEYLRTPSARAIFVKYGFVALH